MSSLFDFSCRVTKFDFSINVQFNHPTYLMQSVSQKNQCVLLPLSLPTKQWKFLSVTHTVGRAFSGGSQLRCYVDGDLVSTEKCR